MAYKCDFCGKEFTASGHLHVTTKKKLYFCSSKCLKNSVVLGRDNKKVKWTNESKRFSSLNKK